MGEQIVKRHILFNFSMGATTLGAMTLSIKARSKPLKMLYSAKTIVIRGELDCS
jgi:hypothetical protein